MPHKIRGDSRRVARRVFILSPKTALAPGHLCTNQHKSRFLHSDSLRSFYRSDGETELPSAEVSRIQETESLLLDKPQRIPPTCLFGIPKAESSRPWTQKKNSKIPLLCHLMTSWLDEIPIKEREVNRSAEFFPLGYLEWRNSRIHLRS